METSASWLMECWKYHGEFMQQVRSKKVHQSADINYYTPRSSHWWAAVNQGFSGLFTSPVFMANLQLIFTNDWYCKTALIHAYSSKCLWEAKENNAWHQLSIRLSAGLFFYLQPVFALNHSSNQMDITGRIDHYSACFKRKKNKENNHKLWCELTYSWTASLGLTVSETCPLQERKRNQLWVSLTLVDLQTQCPENGSGINVFQQTFTKGEIL